MPSDEEPPRKRAKCRMCYTGYRLLENGKVTTFDSNKETSTDPEQFFLQFVKERKPVVIKRALASPNELACLSKFRDSDYLIDEAGSATVYVEKRPDGQARFGQARSRGEEKLKFKDFLTMTKNEKEGFLYYLTTQPLETNEEGRPSLMSEPVLSLQHEFPWRPKLAGNLIPMNYNIWIGASREGSSSGLHHDYHDNFYCLLSGRKKFTLYSPDRALEMHTRGEICQVRKNGLIVYEGESAVGPDGVALEALNAWKADKRKIACEEELGKAEESLTKGEPGAKERVLKAEEALEQALDDALDAEIGQKDQNGDNEVDFWTAGNDEAINDEEEEEDESSFDDQHEVGEPIEKLNNFSVLTSSPVPGLPHAEAVLNAGDLLYLPAGWFHEVTSYSSEEQNHHIAFNYWFHPPTNDSFRHPYTSSFWVDDWAKRMAEMNPST